MRSFRQYTHLNHTIDGFYAEYHKEFESAQLGDTQLVTNEERDQMDNSRSTRNNPSNRFSTAEGLLSVFPTPNNDSSSSSAPVNFRQTAANSNQTAANNNQTASNSNQRQLEYDEYLDMHHKCLSSRSSSGIKILSNNYRGVLHALSGCVISSKHGPTGKDAIYQQMYLIAFNNLATNGRMLLDNTFGVFNRLPACEVPAAVWQSLQLTFDNYSISKKIKDKAERLQSKQTTTEEDSITALQIGNSFILSFVIIYIIFIIYRFKNVGGISKL
jgi:hypothetical protein